MNLAYDEQGFHT